MKNPIVFGLMLFGTILTIEAQNSLTNGLIAYYPFNGNATNQITNLYNGTVNGAMPTTNRFGQQNAAYYFNGSGSIDFGTDLILGTPHTAFTVSVWFEAQTTGPIFGDYEGTDSAGDGVFACAFTVDNNPVISSLPNYVSGGSRNYPALPVDYTGYSGNKIIIDGTWHSLVYQMDGIGSCFVFMDGQLQGTIPYDVSLNYSQAPHWQAGKLYFAGQQQYFTGFIDDIRIYNRALDTNEIQQLFQYESGAGQLSGAAQALRLNSTNLVTDGSYQIQESPDLINWTNYGSPFTATSTNAPQYVDATASKGFFRILPAP